MSTWTNNQAHAHTTKTQTPLQKQQTQTKAVFHYTHNPSTISKRTPQSPQHMEEAHTWEEKQNEFFAVKQKSWDTFYWQNSTNEKTTKNPKFFTNPNSRKFMRDRHESSYPDPAPQHTQYGIRLAQMATVCAIPTSAHTKHHAFTSTNPTPSRSYP
jgi:hypothetical protein